MFKIYLYTEELSHFSEITENSPIMIAFTLLKKNKQTCAISLQAEKKKAWCSGTCLRSQLGRLRQKDANPRSAWDGKIL